MQYREQCWLPGYVQYQSDGHGFCPLPTWVRILSDSSWLVGSLWLRSYSINCKAQLQSKAGVLHVAFYGRT